MKPFNLERALAGDGVQIRDGRKAIWIAHCPLAGEDNRVQVLLEGEQEPYGFCENGQFYSDGPDASNDLFMAPKKRTVWVAVFKTGDGRTLPYQALFDTEDAARRLLCGLAKPIGTYPIEIEE